jgi:hypothetical protein
MFGKVKCGEVQTAHESRKSVLEIQQHGVWAQPVFFIHVCGGNAVPVRVPRCGGYIAVHIYK